LLRYASKHKERFYQRSAAARSDAQATYVWTAHEVAVGLWNPPLAGPGVV